MSPLMIALQIDSTQPLMLLLELSADANLPSGKGALTPLGMAIIEGRLEMARCVSTSRLA